MSGHARRDRPRGGPAAAEAADPFHLTCALCCESLPAQGCAAASARGASLVALALAGSAEMPASCVALRWWRVTLSCWVDLSAEARNAPLQRGRAASAVPSCPFVRAHYYRCAVHPFLHQLRLLLSRELKSVWRNSSLRRPISNLTSFFFRVVHFGRRGCASSGTNEWRRTKPSARGALLPCAWRGKDSAVKMKDAAPAMVMETKFEQTAPSTAATTVIAPLSGDCTRTVLASSGTGADVADTNCAGEPRVGAWPRRCTPHIPCGARN